MEITCFNSKIDKLIPPIKLFAGRLSSVTRFGDDSEHKIPAQHLRSREASSQPFFLSQLTPKCMFVYSKVNEVTSIETYPHSRDKTQVTPRSRPRHHTSLKRPPIAESNEAKLLISSRAVASNAYIERDARTHTSLHTRRHFSANRFRPRTSNHRCL